jgi:hypothetical protein
VRAEYESGPPQGQLTDLESAAVESAEVPKLEPSPDRTLRSAVANQHVEPLPALATRSAHIPLAIQAESVFQKLVPSSVALGLLV